MTGNFISLLKRLCDGNVDFAIVGDFAGIVYGGTYVTQGIEICCDFSAENLLLIQKAVSDLHPVHRMTPNRQKLDLNRENCVEFKNLYLDTDWGQLDCLSFIDGLGDYSSVKQATELVNVEEMQLRVLTLDALIKAKKAMNRPRDNEAVLQLEAARKLKEQK